jgi:hypothetical protein
VTGWAVTAQRSCIPHGRRVEIEMKMEMNTEMENIKELLNSARHEILDLRHRNEILGAQTAVVEVFAVALGLKRNEYVASVDVAWRLQRKIDEIDATGATAVAAASDSDTQVS